MRRIAYLTDVEGRWDKVETFVSRSEDVALDGARLRVSDGAVFVFGGDAIDRGPAGRRIVATLLEAKLAQPDRVVLLAGNRDINKMRLVRELGGHPPSRAPREIAEASPGELLAFILANTMGAGEALGHRRAELALEGRASDPDDAAASFLEDLAPGGALARYLAACQLAFREGATLFVHGALTEESLGFVPGVGERTQRLDAWIDRLNTFYAEGAQAFVDRRVRGDVPGWQALVDYQGPVRGTRLHQGSVVYGRPISADGELTLPPEEVVDRLRREGVDRVVVGHTPAGDCPAVLRDGRGFELIVADTSYGRVERGPAVTLTDGETRVTGETVLDSGEREDVAFAAALGEASPLGLRERDSGLLVKGRLRRGDYLGYRVVAGYEVEQRALASERLSQGVLAPPRGRGP